MKKIKERLIGVIVTLCTSTIMFLTYSYFGSFETKADANSKYFELDKKISLALCYFNDKHCTQQMLQIKRGRK